MNYIGPETEEVRHRRGKLSADATEKVEDIERGIVPFWKHKNSKIADLPDSYLLWLSDQLKYPTIDAVMHTLASVASGIAEERGLFAIREMKRAEQREIDLKSNHIGVIGERLTFEGKIDAVYDKSDEYNDYFVTKILIGNDIVMYRGRKIGERDEAIKMTAKIKRHEVYNEIKQTAVSHPRIKEK
ncbi:hypothetical protein AU106_gp209 [Sinorhizobium phage phiM9]|uniref:Uncharacterized protein n=1 Tax=Sinorhizobium phage phiM9 TaxID=1636182 RepID=A0A0F6R623_9CAUD|nr:hypothetical protein AU106_gp209 [Sinorhizobium phage phiM9]AKE44840.1 hypothetical protein Sm_phiM9_213 [Sinorhizobium phage phiM9]